MQGQQPVAFLSNQVELASRFLEYRDNLADGKNSSLARRLRGERLGEGGCPLQGLRVDTEVHPYK